MTDRADPAALRARLRKLKPKYSCYQAPGEEDQRHAYRVGYFDAVVDVSDLAFALLSERAEGPRLPQSKGCTCGMNPTIRSWHLPHCDLRKAGVEPQEDGAS